MTTATAPTDVGAYTGPPIVEVLRDINSWWPRPVLRADLLRTTPAAGATSVEFTCADCGDTIRLVALWQLAEPGAIRAVDRLRTALVEHRVEAGHEGRYQLDLTRTGGAD